MTNVLVARASWKSLMNLGTTLVPIWTLMGEGFTALNESKNPKEYSRQYIHERSERTDVVGYSPAVAYSIDVHSEDPVAARIVLVTDRELIGSDARVEILSVNEFEVVSTSPTTKYRAYKRMYAIVPDTKGDGTDALIYTGNFRAVGDPVEGTWDGSAFVEGAVTVSNKSTLNALIVQAYGLTEADYTAGSWTTLETALAAAVATANNATATQVQVNTASTSLASAITGLVEA
jgi:hypothetical protein